MPFSGAAGRRLAFAPRGRLIRVLTFTVVEDRITAVDLIGDPSRLRTLQLSTPPRKPFRENGFV
jgi:hypothetical protein